MPDRLLTALGRLGDSLQGYQVSRLQHSLQSATRAEVDGADIEMIVAALVHDLGDELAPKNHSQLAAAIVRPFVRACAWSSSCTTACRFLMRARWPARLDGSPTCEIQRATVQWPTGVWPAISSV